MSPHRNRCRVVCDAQEERDYIIASVVEAGGAENPNPVQVAAFECIVQISQEYYSFLEAYMPTVGPVSLDCDTVAEDFQEVSSA